MAERSIEDRLREEYFDLLPDIRRVAEFLETEIRHRVLPISLKLHQYEQVVVKSRIKECESALNSLRLRKGGTFDTDRPEPYSLTELTDLAGVRVLGFPRNLLEETHQILRNRFSDWKPDHAESDEIEGESLALAYHGYHKEASSKVQGEFQIVSMLTGLFWEVEHSAMYKPTPQLKGVALSRRMKLRRQEVQRALRDFEEDFEALIERDPAAPQKP